MFGMSSSGFISMIITSALGFAIPIALLIIWKRRTKGSYMPAFVGAGAFIVFAMILEQILHTFMIVQDGPAKSFITGNPIIYALYGGLAAGIFEETARFLSFKLLKKFNDRKNAITYGIGHGGMEMILVLGFAMISNITLLISAETMGMEALTSGVTAEQAASVTASLAAIKGITVLTCLTAVIERIFAMIAHISMSVFVFTAAKRGKTYLYPVAILMHTLLNFPAGLYQAGIIKGIWIVELIVGIIAICYGFAAHNLYKNSDSVMQIDYVSYR